MVAGRPSVRYQAVITLLGVLLISSLISSLNGFWHLEGTRGQLFLFSLAAAVFGWIWWRAPLAGLAVLVGGTGLLVGGISLGYMPRAALYLQTVLLQANEFADALRANQLEATFGSTLGIFFLFGAALLAGLVVVPESLSKGSTFWSIAGGTLVFGVEWAWYYDPAALQFTAYGILAFLMWTLGQAAVRDAQWEGAGRKVGYRSHVVTPVVWVLVVGLLATIMPSNFSPIDMGAWGDRAQEAFPVLKKLRGAGVGGGSGRFSLRSTGFTPNMAVWGGPIKLDNSVALQLTMDHALDQTAYLRGATFQVYDGQAWQPGKPEEIKIPDNGVLPSYLGSDVLRDYVSATVKHTGYSGFTVFNFWEPMEVTGLKAGYRADADGNLWSAKLITKNGTYAVMSRLPRYSGDQIRKIGSSAAGESDAPYLQLPSVPDRLAALTQRLTEKAPTPYDKAVAIEGYLRSLPYDLNVPATPQGRDFVEFFLFDLKRGYCVYSASAMAVMLREVGIPSRVVAGFAVPTSTQSTEEASGKVSYAVLNSQAHAWVEAYFPGYGWATFDPTPRSDLPVIDRSAAAPAEPDSTSNSADTTGESSLPVNAGENLQEGAGRGLTEGTDFTMSDQVKRDWPWAAAVIGLLALLFALAYRRLQSQERIGAREGKELVQEVWTKTGSLMRQFDAGPQPYQTAQEYAQVIGKRWPVIREPAADVAREYNEARYGPPDRVPDGQASKDAKSLWEKVHELLFDRFGWRTYLWRRLRWKFRD
jgi:transglutaminase-like putative cysteine protease